MNNKELWIFLFLIGGLLFNWPFLSIFRMSLPGYLFVMWSVFIAAIAVFITLGLKEKNKKDV